MNLCPSFFAFFPVPFNSLFAEDAAAAVGCLVVPHCQFSALPFSGFVVAALLILHHLLAVIVAFSYFNLLDTG